MPHPIDRDLAPDRLGDTRTSPIEQWIAAARAGSNDALGRLMEGCRKYLLLVANEALDSDLRVKAGPSDLVQETFLDVQRDFARFRGSSEAEFFAWLRSIISHRVANHVRRYRGTDKRDISREKPVDSNGDAAFAALVDGDRTPGAQAVRQDEETRLQEALARLPERLRQVLIMRTWDRATFQEIGIRTNTLPDTVRKQWSRAVRELGRELRRLP